MYYMIIIINIQSRFFIGMSPELLPRSLPEKAGGLKLDKEGLICICLLSPAKHKKEKEEKKKKNKVLVKVLIKIFEKVKYLSHHLL